MKSLSLLVALVGSALAAQQYPYGQGFAPMPQAYPQYNQAANPAPQMAPQQPVDAFNFRQIPAGMEQPRVIDPETQVEDPRMQDDDVDTSMLQTNPPPPSTDGGVDKGAQSAPKNCADGDEACKVTAAKAAGPPDTSRDPRLVAALEAVKSDLMAKGHQLVEEKKWLKDVKAMMDTYAKKMKNVGKSVESTKGTMKDLLKKKRQIENLQLQKELKSKLATATDDLTSLETVISHVKNRANQFMEKKKNVEETIKLIQTQLSKLQGKGAAKDLAAGSGEKTQY
jgi:uncharacterized protein YoxC